MGRDTIPEGGTSCPLLAYRCYPYPLHMGVFLLPEHDQQRLSLLRVLLAERFGIYRGRHREPRRATPADITTLFSMMREGDR